MEDHDWADRTYPYILHGDGAVFTKKDGNTLFTVSMRSLLANKFDMNVVPLFTVPKACRTTTDEHNTTDVLWEHVVHILNAAFRGNHPAFDPQGNPWKDKPPWS